jgi:hypothetical protein
MPGETRNGNGNGNGNGKQPEFLPEKIKLMVSLQTAKKFLIFNLIYTIL